MAIVTFQHRTLDIDADDNVEILNTEMTSEGASTITQTQLRLPLGNILRRDGQGLNHAHVESSLAAGDTSTVSTAASSTKAGKCPVSALMRRYSLLSGLTASGQDDDGVKVIGIDLIADDSWERHVSLSRLEQGLLSHMDRWYQQSQEKKCPFIRRRSGDFLDNVETMIKHTMIRKDRWHLMGPPQACRDPSDPFNFVIVDTTSISPATSHRIATRKDEHRSLSTSSYHTAPPTHTNKKKTKCKKQRGLSITQLEEILRKDWRADSERNKGYYVTGRLTTEIYRNDCYFDGPDPDMPIRGLRKYVGVANRLFDASKSECKLLSLHRVESNREDGDSQQLVAHWELQGALRLPWKPTLPKFRGTTIYHIDPEGLIERHEETWDITVEQAFSHTFLPKYAHGWFTKSDKSV